jgi:hypothetical protein
MDYLSLNKELNFIALGYQMDATYCPDQNQSEYCVILMAMAMSKNEKKSQ